MIQSLSLSLSVCVCVCVWLTCSCYWCRNWAETFCFSDTSTMAGPQNVSRRRRNRLGKMARVSEHAWPHSHSNLRVATASSTTPAATATATTTTTTTTTTPVEAQKLFCNIHERQRGRDSRERIDSLPSVKKKKKKKKKKWGILGESGCS